MEITWRVISGEGKGENGGNWAQSFLWASWLALFWTLHQTGWLSPCHLVFFWSFDLFFHLSRISLSWRTCYVVRGGAPSIHHGGATLFPALWHCLWGAVREGTATCWLCSSPTFRHFPQADCALSEADWQVGGFVYVLGPWGPLHGLSCETGSFSRCHKARRFLHPEVLSLQFPTR